MFTAAQSDIMANATLRDRAFAGEIGENDLPRLDTPTLLELEPIANQRGMHQWTSLGLTSDDVRWSRKWESIHTLIVGELNRRGERLAWQQSERAA